MRDAPLTGRETTQAEAKVRRGGLYLFSGLLNEVTQVVLLNTFPHLRHESSAAYYSCPAQEGLSYSAMGLCVCVHSLLCLACVHALVRNICPKRTERGDRYSPCDRQRAGCLMRKWMRGDIHWLPFTHRPPLHSPQHSDSHLDKPSRDRVVTVTTANNNVYFF